MNLLGKLPQRKMIVLLLMFFIIYCSSYEVCLRSYKFYLVSLAICTGYKVYLICFEYALKG
jgi:ABC-type uncharacterized transport system permease subunit